MITIKEYAEDNGISYEAVRQSVKRYQAELEGHIVKIRRTQYLDDFAVEFLDSHRAQNPVVLYSEGAARQMRELEAENVKLDAENRKLLQELCELERWKSEQAMAIASAEQTRLLLTAAEQEKRLLEGFIADAKAEIAVLSGERDAANETAHREAKSAQKAQEELAEAHAAFETDLGKKEAEIEKKNEIIQAWKKYHADTEAWNALGWFKKRKTPKPMPPNEQED